jgi:flagellar hook-associated protein 3 FlgL
VISNLSPSSRLFVINVGRIQQRLSTANAQITSGNRIANASDAPGQISELLQLRANEQQNSQIKTNLGLAQADAQGADDALGSAIQLMESATQIGAEGANGTQTADSRATLAQQVESLMEQMVSISQTQVQGRYIFGGDQDQSPMYQIDLAAPNGVDQLTSTSATREVQDPAGGWFQVSKTAQEIFDSRNPDGSAAPENVFAALNGLRIALLNNDQTGISNALNSVKVASAHLNDMQAFYGTVENRIQNATTYSAKYDTQLQTQIGSIQDADISSAALELTQANTQLQAAFQAEAKMPATSLFDYLG